MIHLFVRPAAPGPEGPGAGRTSVKIEMKGRAMGPELRLEPGKTYDVPDELGRALVDSREAICLDDASGTESEAETASAKTTGETAALTSRKKRAD